MTPEQQAALVISNAATAMIEALGMTADNKARELRGELPQYGETDFAALIERSGIHSNAVIGLFQS